VRRVLILGYSIRGGALREGSNSRGRRSRLGGRGEIPI